MTSYRDSSSSGYYSSSPVTTTTSLIAKTPSSPVQPLAPAADEPSSVSGSGSVPWKSATRGRRRCRRNADSDKEYRCHVTGCDRLYTKISHLRSHVRTHTGTAHLHCLLICLLRVCNANLGKNPPGYPVENISSEKMFVYFMGK